MTILLGMRERGCIKIRAKTNVLLGFNAFRLRLGAENIGLRTPTSLLQKNMICNVIVDIAFPQSLFVFSQSSFEVSASLTNVGGVAVGAIDLIQCFLAVPRFVFVFDVSQ